MEYKLAEYQDEGFIFRFSDYHWINIDLVEQYPNYKIVYNKLGIKEWYYTNQKTHEVKIFNKNKKFIIENNMKYYPSTQFDLDEYLYYKKSNCDNALLYGFLQGLYNKLNVNSMIQETIV
jgi:hypothetical protein